MPHYREELAALQTHRFSLGDLEKAFRCAADKRSGAIKVTIVPEAGW
jgi:threonine dehydrogenase-like Zn-dependent dehydrogenase